MQQAVFFPHKWNYKKKMQSIDMTFSDFLQRHFHDTHNIVKCGVEAVKLGLLHKDCVKYNGKYCLAIVLLEYAFNYRQQEACMPLLYEFFDMKPCLRKVFAYLSLFYRCNHPFVRFCMSFEYFWTDSFAIQQYWRAMPMDVHDKWSPCRVAWIWAVVQ